MQIENQNQNVIYTLKKVIIRRKSIPLAPSPSPHQHEPETQPNSRKPKNRTSKRKLWELFDDDVKQKREKIIIHDEPTMKSIESTDLDDLYHTCHLCNNPLTIMDDGFPTCTNDACGIIYKTILDYSPEWRFYNANDKAGADPTRCGNPINNLLVESSFGCKILCDNRSSYEMKRIRKWTEWQSTPHREKSLYEEFQFITIMAQNSGIPKIFIDHAMIIHKDMSEQKMFRGMNRDGMKSASIYISCRLNGCPRTAYEIADIFKLDKQSATYGCSMAVAILNNIERKMEPSERTELMTTTPSAFIERYSTRLNFPTELSILAKFITKKIENQSFISDNTPQSSAAGIMFFVSQLCKLNISKTEIRKVCCVSEVTINKCYRKLVAIQNIIVPTCILDKYSAL
jgi:transcription initiation factor TFIIB